jgi:hypothetical protein
MSKHDPAFPPPSLAQHFEAPDDFLGCFGWLCGYSADVGFLERAVERFTRRSKAQRAYEGRIALALMLDPGNPQMLPTEVPGALHLPIHQGEKPFKLLHAKVALLGFRHTSEPQWLLRLIVSTGNWACATLEDSLDLAWRVDFSSQDLKTRDESTRQIRADFRSAWEMFTWLRNLFNFGALHAKPPGRQNSKSEATTVEEWIEDAIQVGKGVVPRFFDNRSDSLLKQLPKLIRKHAASCPRNYLAMGSGFYETPDENKRIPSVLQKIADCLQEEGLLTNHPEIDVFVNPQACQAVANSVPAMEAVGWKVRKAGKPEYLKEDRFLHAKFLFSANDLSNSYKCNSPWVYLGSGNLTSPGFTNPMSPQGGNLEAGVVFEPELLQWWNGEGIPRECVITNVLPLQWDDDSIQAQKDLSAGSEMPEPQTLYHAAPIAFLFWPVEEETNWLRTSEHIMEPFDLLDDAGNVCPRESVKGFRWIGTRPGQVRVRWHENEQGKIAWVPVIDELGRIAATLLPQIDIEEAWGQLANFPMPPADEELFPDGDSEPMNGGTPQSTRTVETANYPVRQMMQLIENIAAKQTSVSQADWATWCTRLEQCLIQAAASKVLEEFLKLGLNPLSPLWHAPFRPDFAETAETAKTEEGQRYEEALKRVEEAWNVATLSKLGDQA